MLNKSKLINFIAAKDPEKARKFYEVTLGLKFVSGDQFALVFEVKDTMLRIQIVEEVNPHRYTSLGWEVTDLVNDISELTQRGVKFARYEGMGQDEKGVWRAPSGAKVAWFTDPAGNILSLTEF